MEEKKISKGKWMRSSVKSFGEVKLMRMEVWDENGFGN